jgi:hypothetical protein
MTRWIASAAIAGATVLGAHVGGDPQPPPGVPVDIDYRNGVDDCDLLINRVDGRERCVRNDGRFEYTEYTDDQAAGRRWCAEDLRLNGDPATRCTVKPVREYPEYLSENDNW